MYDRNCYGEKEGAAVDRHAWADIGKSWRWSDRAETYTRTIGEKKTVFKVALLGELLQIVRWRRRLDQFRSCSRTYETANVYIKVSLLWFWKNNF